MLFSLDITIDYIILDDNVFKIVNKNTEIGKKKFKEKKNFALEYVCVSYNRNSIKAHIYKAKQKYYCDSRNTSTSVLSIFISKGYFHEIIPFQ
jgi:hypothetical protein